MRDVLRVAALGLVMTAIASTAFAQNEEGSEPAKRRANPIPDLSSLVGDESHNAVSPVYVAPFIEYPTRTVWIIAVSAEMAATWEADGGRTVPLVATESALSWLGVVPTSYRFGRHVHASKADDLPVWTTRFNVALLLPREK